MKKKNKFSKMLAIVLVLCLMLSAFPNISVFAQAASIKEKLTEKGELWQPESNSNALNFEGDLSIEELQVAKLDDKDTPEIVGQENIEEKGHVNRLWEQEEDLNSIVFQNRDGTKTMYYYNYPVKYKDANGKIRDKSNKISQTSGGDYTNAENDINTYFPKKLNRNKGIELKFGEYVVEMAPNIKGNSGASRQTGHNKYFDPTGYVQYPNVFDESISLRYTPTFEGYKEDIVLSKYAGINEFSFRLYTDGLSLVMNEDGTYYLIDPLSGEVKTQIGDLVVYDSKPFDVPEKILNESVSNPTEEDYAKKEATLKELIESVPIDKNATDELPNTPKNYFHQYKVETVRQDNEYLITIVVDTDYLTDSERVYPVYVDPTISVSGSGTGKTIQDAPIYANKPSTASGGNTYNVVGYQGSTYGVGRTLMKFPGLSSNSTYANLSSNQITSLQLHIYEGSGSTNNACIGLWQYNGTSWTESTARCNNVGWDSYSNNFTWNYINCSGWQTFDLTSMVATWKGSSSTLDKGIMLKNYTSESSSGYSKHFLSTESSYKPYLTYTYNSVTYTTLTNGVARTGTISQGGEYWYKFIPSICKEYTFTATGSTDTYGELYQGSTLLSYDDDNGEGYNFKITHTLVPGTEYMLKVRGYSSTTTGSYSVCAGSTDPFHSDNIEYIRIKKYDQSAVGGDSDITTVVTKSYMNSNQYFEAYAPGRQNVAFTINSSLINSLNAQENSFQDYPTMYLPNFYYHSAKIFVDGMVENGIIERNSAEYYGIWASESSRLLIAANKISSQIQLTLAAVTAIYSIYSFVSSVKVMSMSMNTTKTYYATDYRATAYLADDLLENMTNNPNSNTVMLGTNANGVSYNQVAAQQGRSYFYSANYNNYVNQYGSDAMLATNRAFISNAKNAGKTFWFSHNPLAQLSNSAYANSTYTYELRYLEQIYGITISESNIFSSGGYWYLVP